MVVTRSYQILLPKNDFLPFSHWYYHCNPKKIPTWEGKVVERKQKQFWNQWSNGNNLAACPIGNFKLFWIRIPLPRGFSRSQYSNEQSPFDKLSNLEWPPSCRKKSLKFNEQRQNYSDKTVWTDVSRGTIYKKTFFQISNFLWPKLPIFSKKGHFLPLNGRKDRKYFAKVAQGGNKDSRQKDQLAPLNFSMRY